jgi:alcohol dehydrogenase class IV
MNFYLDPDNDHVTTVDVTNIEDAAMDAMQHLVDTYLEEAQEHHRHMTEFEAWSAASSLLEAVMGEKFGALK